ncbi:alkaline phosphatase family protein [Halostella salina]|uniref:hypothetical protein n=1 Tax=Halostella salina TaxID=1547897 RepID=UPI0013CEDDB9|nr:hypothetical protein [Halostella salina]
MGRIATELVGAYISTVSIVQSYFRLGTNIYEDDWDGLIVLDACRVDALREVQDEYEFLTGIESQWSRGSNSKEWLENTFTAEYLNRIDSTAYITANPFVNELDGSPPDPSGYPPGRDSAICNNRLTSGLIRDDVVSAEDFGDIIELWDLATGEDDPQTHPSPVTDCAITTARKTDYERYIIHYMQPHHPFYGDAGDKPWNKEPFRYLKNGGDYEAVRDAYIDNLRLVLDHVELLLENFDAESVVITADHGELFGEWGLYSHMVGVPHPNLRKVPWVETTASDTGSYEPEYERSDERVSEDELQERLKALGYR